MTDSSQVHADENLLFAIITLRHRDDITARIVTGIQKGRTPLVVRAGNGRHH